MSKLDPFDPNRCPTCRDYLRDCICDESAECFYCGADIDPDLALCDLCNECTERHQNKECETRPGGICDACKYLEFIETEKNLDSNEKVKK